MRSLEIRIQRIFNNLIKKNKKLDSDFVLKQSKTMSSVQSPASKVQGTSSRVQSPTSSVQGPASKVQHPVSRVQHLASIVQGLESSVQSLAFRDQSPVFRVQRLTLHLKSRNFGMPTECIFLLENLMIVQFFRCCYLKVTLMQM